MPESGLFQFLRDAAMVAHAIACWIVFSFWCLITVMPSWDRNNAKWWWATTILTGTLFATFYVFQLR